MREVGRGGMGIVYEALDQALGTRVALKVLPTLNAELLLHFKNEFRALADIHHPNLVRLGELVSEGEAWFFTMEFIGGPTFLDYVRGVPVDRGVTITQPTVLPFPAAAPQVPDQGSVESPQISLRLDLTRLRRGITQLCEGLHALHTAGKVHRDIKPSNILVGTGERVVILDFGLVSDTVADQTLMGLGTPVYMAPEQAALRKVGPAADFYSVGVLLYEALTGQRPFDGLAHEILYQKQRQAPRPARQLAPTVPADLDELCTALLLLNPAARPTGAEILRRLTGAAGPVEIDTQPDAHARFVGRENELGQIEAAYAETRAGKTTVVVIHGESGVGKTSLIRRFLSDVSRADEATVLQGRCYERESVPFKGLDGVVDALTHHLGRLSPDDVMAILPAESALLARAFPVLGRIEPLGFASPPAAIVDPQERRARVFAALRELMSRLGQRKPLVVFIDDLHWADADSLALLEEILRGPKSPPLLLLATAREAPGSRGVGALPGGLFATAGAHMRILHLQNLHPTAAQELAHDLMGRGSTETGDASALAVEAAGHPLFIQELARERRTTGARRSEPARLDDALWARVERLEEPARRILELVVSAAAPVMQAAIFDAAASDPADLGRHVAFLRGAHLVRTRGPRTTDLIETYHDRVRHAVWQKLSPDDRRARQAALARALEGRCDAATLAVYWREAGHAEKASRHAEQAGVDAVNALAFERAAENFRLALELGKWNAEETRNLRIKLADALASAGKGGPAAAEYLAAVDGAPPVQSLALQRRGAEEYLRSGHLEQGMKAAQVALLAIGMTLERTPGAALVALLGERAKLRLRGLRFKERSETEIAATELGRIDLCWSLSSGLGLVIHLQSARFQTRSLRLALKAGEPYRIARGLAGEAGFQATRGTPARRRTEALLLMSQTIAERLGHPHALGMAALMGGISRHLRGEFRAARESLERGERYFRDQCTATAWELDATRTFWIECAFYAGDLNGFARSIAHGIKEATDRGSLYLITNLQTGLANAAWLLADDPDGAERATADALRAWSHAGFHVQHWYDLIARTHIDLYRGDGQAAWHRLKTTWRDLKRSLLLQIQHSRIAALSLRARAALAAAAESPPSERQPFIESAAKDARRLRREDARWADAFAELIDAGIAALGDDKGTAARLLASATAKLEAADLSLFAAAARFVRGELLDDDAGRSMRKSAISWMEAQGVKNPAATAHMMAPGFVTTANRGK